MRHAAINDVRFPDALLERIQTGVHFRQHAFGDGAFLNHPLNVLTRDGGQMAAFGIADTLDVRHHHEFFRT